MRINVLLSLVAAIVSTAGASLNTERIDQLTGLNGQAERQRRRLQNQRRAQRHRGFSRWRENTGLHATYYLSMVTADTVSYRGLFSSIMEPRPSSKSRPKYSKSFACWKCDTGKTAPKCKIRASASVTRRLTIV